MDRSDYDTGDRFFTHYEESRNLPGFHSLLKSGAHLPVNPYLWTERRGFSPFALTYSGIRTERQARGTGSMVNALLSGKYDNQVGGIKSVDSLSGMTAIVQNRLLTKVRNTNVDLGVALGEFGETFDLFASTARTLANAYKQGKKGNLAGVVRAFTGSSAESRVIDVAKSGANALLAWRFGINPLLNDCWNAWDVLCAPPIVKTVKVVSSSTSKTVKIDDPFGDPFYHDTGFASARVRGSVTFEVVNPTLKTLDQLGLTNPLSVAWELVPLSFVVDWFLPVGNYVQSLVPPQGVNYVSGWISQKVLASGRNWTTIPPSGGSTLGWYTELLYTELFKRRYTLSDFPRYSVTPPRWDISSSQLSSAVALLTQALK